MAARHRGQIQILPTRSSDGVSVALHAFAVVAKGTHDVSLDCQGNGNNGGLVDVSVIAVPR